MSARREFSYDLLVTAMDAVKDTHGQPGILQVNFFESAVVLHTYKCSQRRALWACGAGMITAIWPRQEERRRGRRLEHLEKQKPGDFNRQA